MSDIYYFSSSVTCAFIFSKHLLHINLPLYFIAGLNVPQKTHLFSYLCKMIFEPSRDISTG